MNAVSPEDLDQKAAQLLKEICDRGLRIVTAESCTGGLIAAALTDIEGCGHAFERGFVAYTPEAKTELLDVDAGMIKEHSAVSKPVALAMAEGGLRRSNADFCIAVTGYADSAGGTVPAGLVHLALAAKNAPTRHLKMEFGEIGRTEVRLSTLRAALDMLAGAIRMHRYQPS